MLRVAETSRSAARTVRSDERGFSLVELLTGITIGVIVIFAAYTAIDAANKSQLRTAMRMEAINRGRNAMEVVTRSVRSQQCFNSVRPMLWASGTGMEFYASVAPQSTTANGKQPIERHRIEWKAAAAGDAAVRDIGDGKAPVGTYGDITETVWRSTTNVTTGAVTFPTQPTYTNVIARGVSIAPDRRNAAVNAPFFRYFKYASTTGSGRVDLTAPVPMNTSTVTTYNPAGLPSASPTDLAGIVLVEVSFQVVPRKTAAVKSKSVNYYNTVSVRIADPTNPAGSPQCL